MNQPPQPTAWQIYNEALRQTSPSYSSRYLAGVSAAGALVCGLFLAVFAGSPSDGFLPLVLVVTMHLLGQAIASAISLKAGAVFAALALAGQLVYSIIVIISDIQLASRLVFLIIPVICSACALFVAERHKALAKSDTVG